MSFKNDIIPYNPKLKEIAKKLRKEMTLSEVLLWQELKGNDMLGYDFDRQKPIDNFIVDFYCKTLKLAIEVDGNYHNHDEMPEKDELRQQKLESFGIQFLRYSEIEIQHNIKFVLNDIYDCIVQRKTTLSTP